MEWEGGEKGGDMGVTLSDFNSEVLCDSLYFTPQWPNTLPFYF